MYAKAAIGVEEIIVLFFLSAFNKRFRRKGSMPGIFDS